MSDLNTSYYELLQKFQEALRKSEFENVIDWCKKGVYLLPRFIEDTKQEFGQFDITEIPFISDSLVFLTIKEDTVTLHLMRDVIEKRVELEPWKELILDAISDIDLVRNIRNVIQSESGVLQKDLKSRLHCDGRKISNYCYWMNEMGIIKREKKGISYELFLAS